jgi:hypothetical protein
MLNSRFLFVRRLTELAGFANFSGRYGPIFAAAGLILQGLVYNGSQATLAGG